MPLASLTRPAAAIAAVLSWLAATPATAQAGRALKLVVLGDSLSSGFLIPGSQAVPAMLEQSLRARGLAVTVVDAAVTNDTSWNGLARLDRDVPADADGVIVELGANDMVRMVDPGVTRSALSQIVERLRARGVPVLLAGFRMPISWGHDAAGFERMYRELARRYRLTYHPDFYAGLWTHPGYRLVDGIHPSPEGVRLIVSGILPVATRFTARLGRPAARLASHRAPR